jgi:hypothetical protein
VRCGTVSRASLTWFRRVVSRWVRPSGISIVEKNFSTLIGTAATAATWQPPLIIVRRVRSEYAKWDVVIDRERTTGTLLPGSEINRVSDSLTARQWDEMQEDARDLLTTFATSDTRWAVPITQGVISAFLYSLLLIIALLIVKENDIDILHALGIEQTIPAPHNTPRRIVSLGPVSLKILVFESDSHNADILT